MAGTATPAYWGSVGGFVSMGSDAALESRGNFGIFEVIGVEGLAGSGMGAERGGGEDIPER
jgi:hypothetical protein